MSTPDGKWRPRCRGPAPRPHPNGSAGAPGVRHDVGTTGRGPAAPGNARRAVSRHDAGPDGPCIGREPGEKTPTAG